MYLYQRLELAGHNLKVLPEALGGLEALTYLDVSGNGLTDIDIVRQLGSLEELVADNNEIEAAPDFSHMPKLRRISLNNNRLKEVRSLCLL
jgi:Leucine-rich repeat (LRR) protein